MAPVLRSRASPAPARVGSPSRPHRRGPHTPRAVELRIALHPTLAPDAFRRDGSGPIAAWPVALAGRDAATTIGAARATATPDGKLDCSDRSRTVRRAVLPRKPLYISLAQLRVVRSCRLVGAAGPMTVAQGDLGTRGQCILGYRRRRPRRALVRATATIAPERPPRLSIEARRAGAPAPCTRRVSRCRVVARSRGRRSPARRGRRRACPTWGSPALALGLGLASRPRFSIEARRAGAPAPRTRPSPRPRTVARSSACRSPADTAVRCADRAPALTPRRPLVASVACWSAIGAVPPVVESPGR